MIERRSPQSQRDDLHKLFWRVLEDGHGDGPQDRGSSPRDRGLSRGPHKFHPSFDANESQALDVTGLFDPWTPHTLGSVLLRNT
jgi:hypothetical protein